VTPAVDGCKAFNGLNILNKRSQDCLAIWVMLNLDGFVGALAKLLIIDGLALADPSHRPPFL